MYKYENYMAAIFQISYVYNMYSMQHPARYNWKDVIHCRWWIFDVFKHNGSSRASCMWHTIRITKRRAKLQFSSFSLHFEFYLHNFGKCQQMSQFGVYIVACTRITVCTSSQAVMVYFRFEWNVGCARSFCGHIWIAHFAIEMEIKVNRTE